MKISKLGEGKFLVELVGHKKFLLYDGSYCFDKYMTEIFNGVSVMVEGFKKSGEYPEAVKKLSEMTRMPVEHYMASATANLIRSLNEAHMKKLNKNKIPPDMVSMEMFKDIVDVGERTAQICLGAAIILENMVKEEKKKRKPPKGKRW